MTFTLPLKDCPVYIAAHAAWVEADRAFQAELVRVHGRRAGDYRYQPDHDTAEIAALRAAFRRAGQPVQAAWDLVHHANRTAA